MTDFMVTTIVRCVVLGGPFLLFGCLTWLLRRRLRADPVPWLIVLTLAWIVEGVALRVVMQMLVPMLSGETPASLLLEALLWPYTFLQFLRIA